ncbi:hypothetical protein [Streptomyces niveus]|uniref:hypothetical protein n=1 Tax=Streptomyces niveus TaxID=193462 RepID=UPI003643C979
MGVVEFVVTALAFNAVMTWVFNRSGESMLLHTSVDNFVSMVWSDMFPKLTGKQSSQAFLLAAVTAALILLAATRGRLGFVPEPSAQATERYQAVSLPLRRPALPRPVCLAVRYR